MAISPKETIVSVAKVLFGEKGFEGTSVREISKRAKVNVAMIAYYFGCKEKLYMTCLSEFSKERASILKDVLVQPISKADFRDKLKTVLQVMTASYKEDAPMLKILMREVQTDKRKISRELVELTSPFFLTFRDFFQMGINAGLISKDKSADLVTVIFMGALSKPIHAEFAVKRMIGMTMHDSEFQKNYIEHLLNVFVDGVLA